MLGYRNKLGVGEGTTFEKLQKAYAEKGLTLELERTLDEIGARFAEKLFGDEATAIEFINKMNETEDTRTALQKFNVRAYDVELLIRNASDGRKYLYDVIIKKENTTAEITLLQRESRRIAQMQSARDSASKDIVPQSPDSVKRDLSLMDSEGNTLTKAQQEYFKESKVRDKEGNLVRIKTSPPNPVNRRHQLTPIIERGFLKIMHHNLERMFYFYIAKL